MVWPIEDETPEELGDVIRRAIHVAMQEGETDAAAELRTVLLIVPVTCGGGRNH